MAIEKILQVPNPDFKYMETIEPDLFDENNQALADKIDEVVVQTNTNTTTIETNKTNIENALNTQITNLKTDLDTQTAGIRTTVATNKTSAENALNTHKTSTDHDGRYYTKEQVNDYLRGGDTIRKEEVFTIVNSNLGDGTFTYSDFNGTVHVGTITQEGYQTFALQEGSITPNSNLSEMIIGDTLRRSVKSGGLIETDTTHLTLTSPVGNGTEVSIIYYEKIGVSGTGMVIMSPTKPTIESFWFKEV